MLHIISHPYHIHLDTGDLVQISFFLPIVFRLSFLHTVYACLYRSHCTIYYSYMFRLSALLLFLPFVVSVLVPCTMTMKFNNLI